MNFKKEINECLIKHATLPENENKKSIYEMLEERMIVYNDKPVTTMAELKKVNKNTIGKTFEEFCFLWLSSFISERNSIEEEKKEEGKKEKDKGKKFRDLYISEVYLLNNLPKEYKEKLGLLGKVDLGIDIVCKCYSTLTDKKKKIKEKWVAVQCKYVSPPKPSAEKYRKYNSWTVPWSKQATFYGLVARTGEWEQHWLITNAKGVGRNSAMPKDPKGKNICRGSLINIEKNTWYSFFPYNANEKVNENDKGKEIDGKDVKIKGEEGKEVSKEEKINSYIKVNLDEIREKRIKRFCDPQQKSSP